MGHAAHVDPAVVELPGAHPGKRGVSIAFIPDPAGVRRVVQVSPAASGEDLSMAIAHPHVLSLRAIGESDAGPVLLSDYVGGITLAELLTLAVARGRPLPTAVAVRIAVDVCNGLAALHARERTHGAVTPKGIVVGEDGVARLLDPRIERRQPARRSARRPELAYTAPELLGGSPRTPEADVFSIGVIAWEMLARRRLFRADQDIDATRRVVAEQPPRLSEVAPHLGTHLDNVVAKAIAKAPERRYETVQSFAVALETLASRRRWLSEPEAVAAFVRSIAGEALAARSAAVDELARVEAPPPQEPSPLPWIGAAHAATHDAPAPHTAPAMAAAHGVAASPWVTPASAIARAPRPARTVGRSVLLSAIALSPAVLVLVAWGAWLAHESSSEAARSARSQAATAPVVAPVGPAPTATVAVTTLAEIPTVHEPERAAAPPAAPRAKAAPPSRPAPARPTAAEPGRVAAAPQGGTAAAAPTATEESKNLRPPRAGASQAARGGSPPKGSRSVPDDLPSNPYGS